MAGIRCPPLYSTQNNFYRLEMIGYTHAEGPSAVIGVEIFGGANKTMIVVGLEAEHPMGRNAHRETDTAGQASFETVVGTIDEGISIAGVGARIVGYIDIALTPLGSPISAIATEHEIEADIFTTNGEVGHEGELEVEIGMIGGVVILIIVVGNEKVGVVVLGEQRQAGTNAEDLVELIAYASLEVNATAGIPITRPTCALDIDMVAGSANEHTKVPAFGFVVEDVFFGDKVLADILASMFFAAFLLLRHSIDLLIAEENTGRGLHTLNEAGIEERLILASIDKSGSHTAGTGLENHAVFVEGILRNEVGISKSNQCRNILTSALILGHCASHNGQQQRDR